MIRFAYQLLVRLLAPVVFGLFLWRGLRDRGYWQGLHERLGFGERLSRPSIWVHAVSVGEVQAATALLKSLKERYPDTPVILTTGTPTGRARAQAVMGQDIHLRYLPYDSPGAVGRFFDRARPQVAIIIEKELWPNLYRECGLRGVPLVLASATVSPRSVGRYRRLVVLFRETLSHGLVIAAQSAEDAARFVEIGAPPERTHVVGNIKFDARLPVEALQQGKSWRRDYGADSCLTVVAGSTYELEERALLEASRALRAVGIEHVLVLAPRHPPRFDAVAQSLQDAGVRWVRHSQT
jgi:3-deoxy-D-manno-octulosonic-acid transferase